MGRIQNLSLLFVLFLATTFASATEVVKNGIHYRVIELSDGSTDLLEVYIPDGTHYEGNLVILDKVEITEGVFYDVVEICESAFAGSTGITSISIPTSVKSIGRNAFNGCSGIKSIEIPSGITFIDEGAFGNCANLTDLIITEREAGETLTIAGKAFSPGTNSTGTNSVSLNIFSDALNPPEASDDSFDGYAKIQLYCTENGLPDYMETSPWSEFSPTVAAVITEPQEVPAKELQLSFAQEGPYTYTGSAIKPGITLKWVKGEQETTIPADEYTVCYTDSINAGTATVTVTDKAGGNYTFESVSKTYEITPAKGKLENLLTQKPTAIDNLSYTGAAQNLILTGIINESIFKGQLKYSLDNEVFATDIPQGTEAQEYTVYYKAEGDPNYTASDTLSLTVTIKAGSITLSAENISLDNDTYIYDGTAKKPAVIVKTGETTIPADEYTVCYTDSINAGTATVTVTDKAGGNYTFESVSKTYEITQAKGKLDNLLTQKPTAIDNLSYTGEAQNLIQAGIINESIFKGQLKYSLDNEVFATDIPQGTEAQDYTVYYMAEGDPNYTASDTLSLTVTIKAGAIALSAENISLDKDTYVYDGTAKKPAVTVNTGETTIPANEYTVSYADSINAGTATVTIIDKAGGNYSFESVSKTYEITPAKGKLENLLTQKPTAIDNLSYTGEAQNLIQAGILNEEIFKGQLKYSLDNKEFNTDIPQGTEAQDYTVYYMAEGDPNYTPSDTLSLTVTIKAGAIALSAENISLDNDTYIYDGTAKKPAVTVKTGEITIPSDEYTVTYTDSINAGTATVTVTDKAGGNYSFESVSKTYEITPAKGKLDNLLTQKPTAIDNLSYTGEAQNLILTGIINESIFKGQLKYSLDNEVFATEIPQGTEAQDYTVYYKAEGDPNYTASDTLSLTVTIKAGGIALSAENISLDNDTYIYDGTAKKPAVTVKTGETTIPADEYTVCYTDSINAGTATVTVTDKAGGNYTFESVSKTYEITQAKGKLENLLTQKPTGIDLSYTGEAQNLIQAGLIKESIFKGQLKYSLDNIAFDTAIPQGTEAQEYTVYYKAEGDPNYTASDTLSMTVTIKAGSIALSAENISLDNDTYIYDGTAKKPAVTVKTGETTIPADEYTVCYTDSINAGTATVTVTDKAGGNYTFESVSKTYEITPAKGKLENLLTQKPTAIDNLSYTGAAQNLILTGIINESIFKGQLKYSLDNEVFATDIPQGTEAQEYTVYYKAEGDPNYTASDTLSLTVTIKAGSIPLSAPSISIGYYTYTYAGTEIKPDITVKGIIGVQEIIIPAEEYTVSYANNINAGTATVSVTDKEGGHYTFESVRKTFTIAKAPLTIFAGDYDIFEGDKFPEFTPRYDGFVNNETEAVLTAKPIISCNATTTSKPGDYTVSVGGAKAANYNITHKSGKLKIIAMKFVSGGESSKDEDDAATYQITSTGRDVGTTPTVAIVDDKDVGGAFAIPEAVTYHNTNYKVTEINESAFENNKNLTEVTIPSSITSIGDKAFKGCSNLKAITVYITTPISLAVANIRGERTRSDGTSVFEGIDKETCILYVPDGSVELYKAAPVWNEFKHIVSMSSTGIEGMTMTDDECFDIHNLQGQKVKSKATDLKGLPRGIYIINGKKYTVK